MPTPPRLVELQCPGCQRSHWEIDHDCRAAKLVGDRELSYGERTYRCPLCDAPRTGYQVLQQSPPAFFLQPHDLYPMSVAEFGRWLAVFRMQFPKAETLKAVGISWYPGRRRCLHEWRLTRARRIAPERGYLLALSNAGPDDERIRVGVQRAGGEAHFWMNPVVELDRCYHGFTAEELEVIRDLLATREPAIRAAWERFSARARQAQTHWLARLLNTPG